MIHFDIKKLEQELKELEIKTTEQNFWDDPKKSNIILSKIKSIKNKCTTYNTLKEEAINLQDMIELMLIEYDQNLAKDVVKSIEKLEKDVEKLELETMLYGKYDKNNAIGTIHRGAGGTEAQD